MLQGSPAGGSVKYFSLEYRWRKWKMNIVCIKNASKNTPICNYGQIKEDGITYLFRGSSRYDSK